MTRSSRMKVGQRRRELLIFSKLRGLVPAQAVAPGVGNVAGGDEQGVDQLPDAEAAAGDELEDPEPGLSQEKAIDAEATGENSCQEHVVPVQGRLWGGGRGLQRFALRVLQGVEREQNQVDQRPEPEATAGDELENA